ncbi:uncharacterized protein LOC124050328 isoform X4 [Xyrichtys novacula]|uniref:Uncharacterized protein LOC124050328 isoform X4 n=1 Tax=Xyrichtys novacula TaxID=13765 RepID=A0AAV1GWK1_XYRNO|nr:uncharacterized protein LOC124050328 isoform X4 [Xyrichtys novacula]
MEFKWIQMSLFLTALLHFTETKDKGRTVRDGGDVTLICESLIQHRHECKFTTWAFSHFTNPTAAVELVKLGQIGDDVGSKSDRLSVTENCSLLIKKVSEEDVGRYVCLHYPPRGQQELGTHVYLSVVNTAGDKVQIVRAGDDVTLTCENLIQHQHECKFTTWTFSHLTNSAAVKLVEHGQIGEDVGSKSDRLSVTEDCSLLIKKVRGKDAGLYVCLQYPPRGQQEPDAQVFLSVVNMTELKNDDEVTLSCSVWTHKDLKAEVKWLFEDKVVDRRHHGVNTSKRLCCADVTLRPDHLMFRSRYESLQCEVSVSDKKQLFPFRLKHSDTPEPTTLTKLTTRTTTPRPTGSRATKNGTQQTPQTPPPTNNSPLYFQG